MMVRFIDLSSTKNTIKEVNTAPNFLFKRIVVFGTALIFSEQLGAVLITLICLKVNQCCLLEERKVVILASFNVFGKEKASKSLID